MASARGNPFSPNSHSRGCDEAHVPSLGMSVSWPHEKMQLSKVVGHGRGPTDQPARMDGGTDPDMAPGDDVT